MALTITIPGAVEATIGATAPAILTVGVGVPGATGATGATGAQGPQGDPGEGVPVGGSAGQVLAKIDGTNYNTEWVNVEGDYLPLAGGAMDANASITASDTGTDTDSELAGWGLGVQLSADHTKGTTVEFNGLDTYDGASHMQVTPTGITFPDASVQSVAYPGDGRPLTDYDFTNVADTKLTTYGLTIAQSNPAIYSTSYLDYSYLLLNSDNTSGGTVVGSYKTSELTTSGLYNLTESFTDVDGTIVSGGLLGFNLAQTGLTFNASGTTPSSGSVQYLRSQITFGNGSVQTIAFPGFNNVALTGTPTAPTAALADNDTSIATTAFVQQELASGTANARNLEVYVRNQTGSTIPIGSIVYINGATGNRPTVTLAQANNDTNSAQTIGFTKTAIANNGFGFVIVRGELEGLNTNSLTEGVQLYLSPTTAGAYTITKPSAPQHLVYVGIVIRAHPTLGVILVSVQNGYELNELHDVALASEANNDLLTYESSTDLWKNKSFATLGLATLASPTFTGTPSLPTGTTGITQTAGNNTTALATTAFVTAAVPAFASVSDVLTGSSTTTAVNPLLNYVGNLNPAYFSPDVAQLSSTVTGTGSSSALNANGYTVQLGSTAGSYATRSQTLWPNRVGVTGNLQWTRPVGFGARVAVYNRMDANAQFGISFGQATATLATPTVRSIGCYFAASAANTPGVLVLEVHNGTTYTTVNSSYTPTFNLLFDVVCYSDGAGNVTLYVNGSQVATTSAGPSTNGGTTYQTVLQAGYKAIGTPTGTSNSVFNCLKFLTN